MDPTELTLLAGVCANPADDTARLVYADWMQENGQEERGEFVRVQVALAKFGPKPPECGSGLIAQDRAGCKACQLVLDWQCDTDPIRQRERQLLITKSAEDVWPTTASAWADKYEFSRGFLSSLTCSAVDFFAHADELVWQPGCTMVCGRCSGDGKAHGSDRPFEWSSDVDYGKCVVCKGSGRVVREQCPPAAQPIEEVTFTDWPNITVTGDGVTNLTYTVSGLPGEFQLRDLTTVLRISPLHALRVNEILMGVCAIRFKGIEFKLTPGVYLTVAEVV